MYSARATASQQANRDSAQPKKSQQLAAVIPALGFGSDAETSFAVLEVWLRSEIGQDLLARTADERKRARAAFLQRPAAKTVEVGTSNDVLAGGYIVDAIVSPSARELDARSEVNGLWISVS